jgi:hypothetical protein
MEMHQPVVSCTTHTFDQVIIPRRVALKVDCANYVDFDFTYTTSIGRKLERDHVLLKENSKRF